MVKFYGQYKQRSEDKWIDLTGNYSSTDHRWEVKFNTNINSRLGFYNFRVKFENNKSISSDWVYLNDSLEVLNNPPVISEDLNNVMIGFERRFINLSKYGSDIEDLDKDLSWSVDQSTVDSKLSSITIMDISEYILNIVPKDGASGIDDITITLTDKDGDRYIKSNITIYIGNKINKYYNVNISISPNRIGIYLQKSHNVTLIISNIGNLSDNYTIFFEFNEFTIQDIKIEKNLVSLNSGDFKNVNVTITIPKDMKIDIYNIKFKVKSDFAIDDTILTINVKERDIGTKEKKDNTLLFVSISIIIIIVIIVLILLFLLVFKKKPGAKLDHEQKDQTEILQSTPQPQPQAQSKQYPPNNASQQQIPTNQLGNRNATNHTTPHQPQQQTTDSNYK